MILHRFFSVLILLSTIGALLGQWHYIIGFEPMDRRWWWWLFQTLYQLGTLPDTLLYPFFWTMGVAICIFSGVSFYFLSPSSRAVGGDGDSHGSASWASWRDVKRAGLAKAKGVVVGGYKRGWRTIKLFHDGPEHVLAFAPTRSGKGVALVIPTLLSWLGSVLVLDIKGEAFAFTAGWRKLIGQLVLRFEPAALSGSCRYNPLAEVRIGTDYEIADCQNIALMLIDTDGKGLKDYFKESGWEWLSAVILHVLYRVKQSDNQVCKTATLADVHAFMSVGNDEGELSADADEGFAIILDDMVRYDHGSDTVNGEVRRAAGRMLKRAGPERSGVHSTATVPLALYSDPIVARNTSECDFRISDLMNGRHPTSLYIVIAPSDLQRLRPLTRILMNQILTRLTAEMEFEGGAVKKNYKHRLLLMLDEFTSIGKLEIFEKALAFMAGYGLKAFIIIQDLTQLQKEYGRDESIVSNCHIRIAYAPNKIETAKLLSEWAGKMTLLMKKRSRSHGKGGGSVSDSLSEISRELMKPEEVMCLPGIRKGWFSRLIPGDMLIFVAGQRPIYGRQTLYFQDRVLKKRAAIAPPIMKRQAEYSPTPSPTLPEDAYETALREAS